MLACMSNALYRLGRWSARHRRLVLTVWAVALVVILGAGRLVGGSPVDDFRIPGTETQEALDLLAERFPERAGASAMVVFHTAEGTLDGPDAERAIDEIVREVRALDHVASVSSPLQTPGSISQDRQTSFARVGYDQPASDLGRGVLDELEAATSGHATAEVETSLGGELPTVFKERSEGFGEIVGILAALVILFLTFRALAAMFLPVGVAVIGLAIGLSLVTLLGAWMAIPSIAPRLATMIGLGVGIDYALFILSRHRDQIAHGMDIVESIGRTNATAGQAVVVAGGTVMIAILGLAFAGIPFVAALGYAASIVVAIAVVIAVTLVPAILGFIGDRVLSRTARGSDAGADTAHEDRWARWSRWVAHHPWPGLAVAMVVLVLLAVPMFSMHLGQADAGSDPAGSTQRRAYDLLARGFGPGINGPLLIALDLGENQDPELLERVHNEVAGDPGIAMASPPEVNATGDAAVMTVIPESKPQDEATSELVHRLRDVVLPDASVDSGATALVGGPTAGFIDQSDRIAQRLGWFIAGVIAMAFVLLVVVFRSLVVPLVAAVLNVLSIGAAYGVVTAVFQWGWGRSLVGLHHSVPIAAFVPMMMFAILFGLSMDYQVFILSRVREEYTGGRSNIDSVVHGLAATAKVITAAALIMVAVFGGFVSSDDTMVKMVGVGLATAIAIDATVVRMLLVPSVMTLVGDANWWLPRWLDRLLPHLELEPAVLQPEGEVP